MRIHVKGYKCPPHHVRSHKVKGYMRKVPGHNRMVRIDGHIRHSYHSPGRLVQAHVRSVI